MMASTSSKLRCRTLLLAAAMSSAVLLQAVPARAIWQNSNITLIEFLDVCRDGVRFSGAVRDGSVSGPRYKTRAIAAQPPPTSWNTKPALAMRRDIAIPRLAQAESIPVGDPSNPDEVVTVSHKGSFTTPYASGSSPLARRLMALNLEDGHPDSDVNTATVAECYLFAPIDVQPGLSPNKVHIGKGDVAVGILATKTFRSDLAPPATYRFGPKSAAAKKAALRDVNRDKRTDLVLTFGSAAAGLTCKSSTVKLTGKTKSGGKVEGSGTVAPTGCP